MDDVSAFVEHLVMLGRSSCTLRTYRLGVEHFRRWLGPRSLDEVSRPDIAEYIGEYAAGEDRARAARTVNHRLAALAAFFAFLIERDTRRSIGYWGSRENPVPTGVRVRSIACPARTCRGAVVLSYTGGNPGCCRGIWIRPWLSDWLPLQHRRGTGRS